MERLPPMEPEQSVIHLRLPDLPGVKAVLDVEMVGDMESVKFLHKLLSVGIVGLVFGGGSDIDVELPGTLIRGENIEWAILANIGSISTPDASLATVVPSERDHYTEDVRMMDGDIHGSKTTHRETTNATIRGLSYRAILLIDVLDQIDSDVGFDVLSVVTAFAPFNRSSWSSIAIGGNQDQFRCFTHCYQGIRRLIRFAGGKPIALTTG